MQNKHKNPPFVNNFFGIIYKPVKVIINSLKIKKFFQLFFGKKTTKTNS